MNKEVISKNQMQLLIFTYPLASYLLYNMGALAKQDAWIASIMGLLLSIPILLLYGWFMNLYPGKNLFDILDMVFGRILGKILNILFIFHLIFLASIILNDFTDFVKLSSLWNTPVFIPILCIGLLSIWILKNGIRLLSSWCKFHTRFVILFIFLSLILLLPKMEISRLQPFFYNDFKKIFKTAISLSVFPFGELFIFLTFFDCMEEGVNTKNIFIKPVIIAGLLCTLITIINLMLLGSESYSSFYYSGYEAIKKIHLRGEYQRLEIIVSIIYTLVQFLELNYCIFGACKGVEKLFNLKDYRDTLVPIVFLILNFSYIMFESMMKAKEFIKDLWTFYGILIQVVIPIIIFIVALFKKRLSS